MKNAYKLYEEGKNGIDLSSWSGAELLSRWVFRKYAVYILYTIYRYTAVRAHTHTHTHDLTPFVTISSHVFGYGFTLGRRRDLYFYILCAAPRTDRPTRSWRNKRYYSPMARRENLKARKIHLYARTHTHTHIANIVQTKFGATIYIYIILFFFSFLPTRDNRVRTHTRTHIASRNTSSHNVLTCCRL